MLLMLRTGIAWVAVAATIGAIGCSRAPRRDDTRAAAEALGASNAAAKKDERAADERLHALGWDAEATGVTRTTGAEARGAPVPDENARFTAVVLGQAQQLDQETQALDAAAATRTGAARDRALAALRAVHDAQARTHAYVDRLERRPDAEAMPTELDVDESLRAWKRAIDDARR